MPKYPFLSDEWVAEARRLYAEAASALQPARPPAPVKVNLIVTEAPFSDQPVNAHVDTSNGMAAIGPGHLSDADVTVSTDYTTARALFIAGDTQALMQAFLAGRIRVDGNLSKLLDPASGIWPTSPVPATGQQPSPEPHPPSAAAHRPSTLGSQPPLAAGAQRSAPVTDKPPAGAADKPVGAADTQAAAGQQPQGTSPQPEVPGQQPQPPDPQQLRFGPEVLRLASMLQEMTE
jgi:hypothetical protein